MDRWRGGDEMEELSSPRIRKWEDEKAEYGHFEDEKRKDLDLDKDSDWNTSE
jgi:hypothetical protein